MGSSGPPPRSNPQPIVIDARKAQKPAFCTFALGGFSVLSRFIIQNRRPACFALLSCPVWVVARSPAVYNNRIVRCGLARHPFSLAARRITVVGGYHIAALPSVPSKLRVGTAGQLPCDDLG
jgi:hypothetical protein